MAVEGGDKLARTQMMAEETARKHMRECALEGAESRSVEVLSSKQAPWQNIYKGLRNRQGPGSGDIGPGKRGWYGALLKRATQRGQKG